MHSRRKVYNLSIWVYPGSFDPITNGHLDIITRAACLCDRLIVAVGNNSSKNPAFSVEERIEFINQAVAGLQGVETASFSGLLTDFMKKTGAKVAIKGLRFISDFEYEFQMALVNKNLVPEVETLFMMTSASHSYLSSLAVREVGRNGGSIDGFVPECIKEKVMERLLSRSNG